MLRVINKIAAIKKEQPFWIAKLREQSQTCKNKETVKWNCCGVVRSQIDQSRIEIKYKMETTEAIE